MSKNNLTVVMFADDVRSVTKKPKDCKKVALSSITKTNVQKVNSCSQQFVEEILVKSRTNQRIEY